MTKISNKKMKLSKPTAKPINILSISLITKEYVIYLIKRKNKTPEIIAKIADIIEYIVSFISLWNIHLNFKSKSPLIKVIVGNRTLLPHHGL